MRRIVVAAVLSLIPTLALAQSKLAPESLPAATTPVQPTPQDQMQAAMSTVADLLRATMQQRAQIIADQQQHAADLAEIARLKKSKEKR